MRRGENYPAFCVAQGEISNPRHLYDITKISLRQSHGGSISRKSVQAASSLSVLSDKVFREVALEMSPPFKHGDLYVPWESWGG